MGRRISCPVCGCRTVRGLRCGQCGERYRGLGDTAYPPIGTDFLTGVVILVAAVCCVLGLLI
jgi:hypothetical protein